MTGYWRYFMQVRSSLAVAEFFRTYPRFRDCEFTCTDRSVTIFAREPDPDLEDICEAAGFDLVVEDIDPTHGHVSLH